MFQVHEINKKGEWDKFLAKKEIYFFPFFQTWNFGEVQEKLGCDIVRRGVWKGRELVAVYQIIDVLAKRGHLLHLRHGPVLAAFDITVFNFILRDVKNLAKKRNASFIRISPLIPKQLAGLEMFREKGFINAPIHNMDAEVCWVLDITKPEGELLSGMRKSHRYLIKKGLKIKDLRLKKTKEPKDIKKFLPLYKSLSKQKHFVPHKGIKEEFEIFGKDDQEVLFLAEFLPAGRQGNKKIIAGGLIAFIGDTAIYRHSASDENYKNIPAMHLILWEAILEAKKRGKKFFNFWGIAPTDSKRHPWQGLTLFKTGFGGEKQEFLHSQDLPLNLWYFKTWGVEYITKIIKGY